jgi:hypothetical protein
MHTVSFVVAFSVGLALLTRLFQQQCKASCRGAGEQGRGGLSSQTRRPSPHPTPVPEAPAPR